MLTLMGHPFIESTVICALAEIGRNVSQHGGAYSNARSVLDNVDDNGNHTILQGHGSEIAGSPEVEVTGK